MPYDALAIANHFIDLAEAAGAKLTPMKLQKLVYYAHGWHLGLIGEPLLDEQVQAWSYGPVVRSVYNAFRDNGAEPILEKGTEWQLVPGHRLKIHSVCPSIEDESTEDREFVCGLLNQVWTVYGGYSGIQLSNLTHAPGTPWERVFKHHKGKIPKYTTISDEWIREYFAGQVGDDHPHE